MKKIIKKISSTVMMLFASTLSVFAQFESTISSLNNTVTQVQAVARIAAIVFVLFGGVGLACSFIFSDRLSETAKKKLTGYAIGLVVLGALSGIVGWVRGLSF